MGAQGPGNAPRVVLDTNVVVSALVFRHGAVAWVRNAWLARALVPLASQATIDELVRVLAYPKFRLEHRDIEELLAVYLPFAELVLGASNSIRSPTCRDEDDQEFLELAYMGNASHLVTGDAALLELAGARPFAILSPAALRARRASPDAPAEQVTEERIRESGQSGAKMEQPLKQRAKKPGKKSRSTRKR